MSPEEVAQAAELACLMEVMAPKPGNVNRYVDFVDTTFEDFVLSAWASAPVFRQAGERTVGQLILAGVQATRQVVRSNTNLGIWLLFAPLAKAALSPGTLLLRDKLATVLENLTVDDTKDVYTAIFQANAGGLGRVPKHDVSEKPVICLLTAMELACLRDSIAAEYCSAYEYTFTVGVPAIDRALKRVHWTMAVVEAFLALLAHIPDTLIARKVGWEKAKHVSCRAKRVLAAGLDTAAGKEELVSLDDYLRSEGNRLNPGTTADLIAASIFVLLLQKGYGSFLAQRGGKDVFGC